MPDKYCPLITKALESHQNQTYCLEAKCAWWDIGYDQCMMLTIPTILFGISEEMQTIKQQMPTNYPSGR